MSYSYDRALRVASVKGPNVDMDARVIVVWMDVDAYGRTHHVMNDLKTAEKILETSRKAIVGAQRDILAKHDLKYNIGEVVVDGSAIPGRNRMIVYYSITPVGRTFTDLDEDAFWPFLDRYKYQTAPFK